MLVIFFSPLLKWLQVAERALFLWNNEHLVMMATQNRHVILPLIIDVLEENTNSHWNLTVNELTSNVRKMFLDLDPKLFHACQKEYQESRARAHSAEETREKTWRSVELLAASLAEEGRPVSHADKT
jgi:serine/threonine-protein phosphatase 2A regulatory subunit B'